MAKEYLILQETIKKIMAESQLDTGGKYFVLKDTLRDIESEYLELVKSELTSKEEEVTEHAESV